MAAAPFLWLAERPAPDVAENLTGIVAGHITFASVPVDEFFAPTDAVIYLSDKEETDEINILRDDLARIVGTAKESVIRMLTEFKNDGYIDIVDGTITIRNRQKLEDMPG